MAPQQLLLFAETKEEELERSVNQLQKQVANLRRGLFARNSELVKMYLDNRYELDILRRDMCRMG